MTKAEQLDSISHIPIGDLVPGMFVIGVLKQSGQLRIKTQGLVKSKATVQQLRARGILEVQVDMERSNLDEIGKHQTVIGEEETSSKSSKEKSEGQSFTEAQALYDKAKIAHKRFLKRMQAGQVGNLESLKQSCNEIIESLFENANALQCLTLIKDDQEYLLQHCLNSAILMGVFAKHLGFDKELINELCLAGLLMDAGMSTVPKEIYEKPRKLNSKEWSIVKSHVDTGMEMVERMGELSETVLNTIANHHERLDGTGYPSAKAGKYIGIYGRMAAIVDIYDALTSDRPWRKAYSPTAALKQLLADDSGKIDPSLVQQFIKCIGVHPVGSLVKLKSDRLGIIIKANTTEPLKPVVMCFYSLTSGMHTELKRVDLSIIKDEIVTSVRPEEFKINLNKFFREVFLANIK